MVERKDVNTVVLQPQLAEHLSQVAEQDATTLEELVNTAVREYVDVMARRKIHAESKAFRVRHTELLQRYLPVLLRQVTEQAELKFTFRSPQVEWLV